MCLKPKVKKMNGFVLFITGGWAAGITLAPFGIYIKEKYLTWTKIINHEKIHWQQQMEMIVAGAIIAAITVGILLLLGISSWWLLTSLAFPFLFFYLWYLIEWLFKFILPPYDSAYSALSHEREANAFENDYEYLNNRKHFAWLKYLFHA